MTWDAELAAIARAHLSADDAEAWISLLRPGMRLAHHGGGATPVAARLGGDPLLLPYMAWPSRPGKGPLTFIASVDCAAVTEAGTLDIPLPEDGALLFFLTRRCSPGSAADSPAGMDRLTLGKPRTSGSKIEGCSDRARLTVPASPTAGHIPRPVGLTCRGRAGRRRIPSDATR